MRRRAIIQGICLAALVICSWPVFSGAQELAMLSKPQAKENAKLLVDLDLKDADIRDVVRAFSRISGINIIVNQDVKANVTLRIQSTDWREALDMILGANNLTMLESDNYIVITTFETRRQTEERGELKIKVISFNFVEVNKVKESLSSMLTTRGKMEVDVRTNSLIIMDIPSKIDAIEKIATQLDTKTPQVMIEAMMLTVKLNDDEKWGVNWTLTHKEESSRSIHQVLTASAPNYITYGKNILPWALFSSTIDLWLENKKAEILANPRILTLDNLPANINLTENVAYTQQETSPSGGEAVTIQSTQFKEVPVKLTVTPHITKDGYIFMNIKTEQSYQSGTSNSQPIIDSRKAETNVVVRDGETVVIGGLRKKENTVTIDKFPLLGDLPLVGNLFRKRVVAKVDTELIIFVTPQIITSEAKYTPAEAHYLDQLNDLNNAKTQDAFKETRPFPLRSPAGVRAELK